MKKGLLVICLCLCAFILFGCSSNTPAPPTEAPTAAPTEVPTEAPTDTPAPTPNTVSVDITPENFKQYFDVSVDVSNQNVSNESYSFGVKSLDLSGSVTLSIVSKIPCELHNVQFSITATGGAYIGMTNMEEKNLSFSGTIPQSGSYTSSKQVSFPGLTWVGSDYEVKYYCFSDAIKSASGFIVIDPRDQ